ncbi:hypothetical protein Q8A73_018470 [Channa argus]|nr:hypothetical protein Q8A73_018470 [Channa argus]
MASVTLDYNKLAEYILTQKLDMGSGHTICKTIQPGQEDQELKSDKVITMVHPVLVAWVGVDPACKMFVKDAYVEEVNRKICIKASRGVTKHCSSTIRHTLQCWGGCFKDYTSDADFFVYWGNTICGIYIHTHRHTFKTQDLDKDNFYQQYSSHQNLALAPEAVTDSTYYAWLHNGCFVVLALAVCIVVISLKDSMSPQWLQPLKCWEGWYRTEKDLSWYIVFTLFATYTLLLLPLLKAICAGSITSVLHLLLEIVFNYNDAVLLRKVFAKCLLFLGMTAARLCIYYLTDLLLETPRCIVGRLQLDRENHRQHLVLSILPCFVALEMIVDMRAMKDEVSPQAFDKAYIHHILFADIKGFTVFMNLLAQALDTNYCYYCVSGVPEPQPAHACYCVEMSLAMINTVRYVGKQPDFGMEMRSGIHSGSVLCGVSRPLQGCGNCQHAGGGRYTRVYLMNSSLKVISNLHLCRYFTVSNLAKLSQTIFFKNMLYYIILLIPLLPKSILFWIDSAALQHFCCWIHDNNSARNLLTLTVIFTNFGLASTDMAWYILKIKQRLCNRKVSCPFTICVYPEAFVLCVMIPMVTALALSSYLIHLAFLTSTRHDLLDKSVYIIFCITVKKMIPHLTQQEVEDMRELQEHNNSLLHNILPVHMLFSTTFSGPKQKQLGESYFHCVEKFKTIEGCYMAASGFTLDKLLEIFSYIVVMDEWNQLELVLFALAMQETLKEINGHSAQNLQLRVGDYLCFVTETGSAHGSLVTGMIDATKPQYDIWGATVNLASRMDSTGVSECIQVPEATHRLLSEFGFALELCGECFVRKCQGKIRTYFISTMCSKKADVGTDGHMRGQTARRMTPAEVVFGLVKAKHKETMRDAMGCLD